MNSDLEWQSALDLDGLTHRSHVFAAVRNFLSDRGALEVDVPALGRCTVTDPYIDSIVTMGVHANGFLQSSPEFFMKRLLASGSGDIFTLGKAFRAGENGANHNPEFTLLEWYRVGWDEHQLMAEVAELVTFLQPSLGSLTISYREAFLRYVGIDPHAATLSELQELCIEKGADQWAGESRTHCLDLLFNRCVEPRLPDGLVFLFDYPSCQAALSQLHRNREGQQVSRRFEVYLNKLELANGYFELTDAQEQRRRFQANRVDREAAAKMMPDEDVKFLAAMDAGLPSCAGVALGVDRLIMQLQGESSMAKVMPFNWSRC